MIDVTIKTDEAGMYMPHKRVVEYFNNKGKLALIAKAVEENSLRGLSFVDLETVRNILNGGNEDGKSVSADE